MQMRAGVENHVAFYTWWEVLDYAEKHLGMVTDHAELLIGRQQFNDLTLRGMIEMVETRLPAELAKTGQVALAVLEAASRVAGHTVEPSRLDEPILVSLGIELWGTDGPSAATQ
jgi:hypothetical protein